jgi:hypothetical protein
MSRAQRDVSSPPRELFVPLMPILPDILSMPDVARADGKNSVTRSDPVARFRRISQGGDRPCVELF